MLQGDWRPRSSGCRSNRVQPRVFPPRLNVASSLLTLLDDIANSWVGSGPNQPVPPGQLGSALGPDIIKSLAQRTGLPEEELTKQLAQALPGVVDKLTPAGRLPTLAELPETRTVTT